MADSQNGGSKFQQPKEMSMELRLLLALVLTVPILFIGPYFFGTQTPPPKKIAEPTGVAQPAAAQTANPAAPQESAKPAAAAETSKAIAKRVSTVPGGAVTDQQQLPTVIVQTDLYRVSFTNHGATVRSWQLKGAKFKDNDGKQVELVNSAAGLAPPFSFYLPEDKDLEKELNWSYYTQAADPDGLGVTYRFSDGHVSVKKVFRFQKNSYLSQVSTEILVDGKPLPHMIQWRGGFGDLTVPSPTSNQHSVHYDIALKSWWRSWLGLTGTGGLVDEGATAASKGPIQNAGTYSFAGIADSYFAAVLIPVVEDAMRQTVFTDTVPTPAGAKPVALSGDAFSDGDSNRFGLFVGPKDVDLLKSIDPKLEQLVDFGFASALAKPLFLIVNWANDQIVHNFGWSIILVTIVINFALFPLKLSSMKSMRKMQALKPQIDAINAKYKGISVRDPKKSEQTEETMALYKKHGVNPMGGCLPMVIQLPILYAFYAVLRNSVEMRGASWLWVGDLSQPEHLPIKILPIVMIATQFLTQKMMPQPGADPAQQKMTQFMPLLFGFMFYNFASGLVLYYLTSNLVGIGQQWFFNHTDTARAVALSVEPPAKKKNGKK
jgi:YidC/Oxa1 family membrane protein insertase